jgi:predicted Zn-dependent protease
VGCQAGLLPAQFAAKSRSLELRADQLAVEFLAALGYDSGALVRYLQRAYRGQNGAYQSSVPQLEERLAIMSSVPTRHSANPATVQAYRGGQRARRSDLTHRQAPEPAVSLRG